ncbi:hypothetical protein SAY87_026513 [Trapa incisa]|uniref:Myb/SANT-like DNA-binding domain-containing protein n=1 Tax=Trapa incisa TaxID=236973 RepID=A0AAN7JL43_9MYRT|nr:hypothetical protein SAY87_026513 [Trapa incisa]
MATPPSSPSPTKLAAAAVDSAAATSNPLVKPPPATWSHQETVQLIQIYRDKWYSNNRAHLKTIQWEEVAAAVASRCGVSGKLPPKTAIQCRHKIEKLRKRFRAERKRGNVGPAGWPYYDLMDRLEHGPKASVMPLSIIPYKAKIQQFHSKNHGFGSHRNGYDEEEDEEEDYNPDDDENDEDDEPGPYSRSQSINYILRRPSVVNRFPRDNSIDSTLPDFPARHPAAPKRKREEFMDGQEEALEESARIRKASISNIAREIRAFAETYVGIENAKMQMMKEAERSRLEMETKRMELIMDSQKKMVEAIAKALVGDPLEKQDENGRRVEGEGKWR